MYLRLAGSRDSIVLDSRLLGSRTISEKQISQVMELV